MNLLKKVKSILSVALMLCILGSFLVIPDVAQAANYKGKTQRFLIRLSGSYDSTDVKVKMTSTSTDGKKGTIAFEGTVPVYDDWGRKQYYFEKGLVYNYTISNLWEGGKITLTYNEAKSGGVQADVDVQKLTGKIHIDKKKGCSIANIWKIDSLKFSASTALPKKPGWYFRND